ncbi:hypothetical protein VTL71DRAFT_9025 [Oculimacula yallundae]|uniref:Hemerythrin-like domain-containing protein n=1 Tax=Oculimacula yallundae TaxID=86028 RepID=A0ABR4BTJ5_9HELO
MAKKQWADGPIQLMSPPKLTPEYSPETIKVASEMTFAHNAFIRSLNSMTLQHTHIHDLVDISDFLTYCYAFYIAIHHHHWGEEAFFFPAIEAYTKQPGLMSHNVDQHKAFDTGLEEFHVYVTSTKPEEYDAGTFGRILASFAETLEKHLREEIGTLLELERYGGKELKGAWDLLEKNVMANMGDPNMILPGFLGSHDSTFEGGIHHWWPPFPFFMPYLIKYWYMRKHQGAWRFSPCDAFGVPKELPFLEG